MIEPTMLDFCIAELAELVDGKIQFGAMPPLAGNLERIGQIVFDPMQVRSRNVYWALRVGTYDGSMLVEDAFTRGAIGVVLQGRRIEPWAGNFCISVPDGVAALHRLMRCLRTARGNLPKKLFGSGEQTSCILKCVWERNEAGLELEAAALTMQGALAI